MYKVVGCTEDCVYAVKDIDSCKLYYVNELKKTVIKDGIEYDCDNISKLIDNDFNRVFNAIRIYQCIDNKRFYYSVYDVNILDFYRQLSFKIKNLTISDFICKYKQYFNLIESCYKIIESNNLNSQCNVMCSVIKCINNNQGNCNFDIETYLKNIIYILNNDKYLPSLVHIYIEEYADLFVRYCKKIKGYNIFNKIDEESYKERFIMFFDGIYINCDKIDDVDLCVDMMTKNLNDKYNGLLYNVLFGGSYEYKWKVIRYLDDCSKFHSKVSDKKLQELWIRAHDAYKERDNKIKNVAEKYNYIEDFEYNGFHAYLFKSADDFQEEGKYQNNCVGRNGYDEAMNEEKSIVGSLRACDTRVTFELDKNLRIKQIFGYGNKPADYGLVAAFKSFLESKSEKSI